MRQWIAPLVENFFVFMSNCSSALREAVIFEILLISKVRFRKSTTIKMTLLQLAHSARIQTPYPAFIIFQHTKQKSIPLYWWCPWNERSKPVALLLGHQVYQSKMFWECATWNKFSISFQYLLGLVDRFSSSFKSGLFFFTATWTHIQFETTYPHNYA